MSNEHIVYAAFDDKGVCLYVGEGKPDRYKHITSGVSHVYEANKWHFKNKFIEVKILHKGLTKSQAVEYERQEIVNLHPVWNKSNATERAELFSFALEKLNDAVSNNRRGGKSKDYVQLCKDLCRLMSYDGVVVLIRGQKWTDVKIPTGFMSCLAAGDERFYRPLMQVFHVERSSETGKYTVTLRGWKCKEERKNVPNHA